MPSEGGLVANLKQRCSQINDVLCPDASNLGLPYNGDHQAKTFSIVDTIHKYGTIYGMKPNKKYTLELDEGLVKSAIKATGKSFTDTVRQGLRILASTEAYRELAKLRGSVDLELNVKDLRKDKRDLR